MTDDETEQRAQEAYAASADPGALQIPWADLPAFIQNTWRALVRGDAGAAVD